MICVFNKLRFIYFCLENQLQNRHACSFLHVLERLIDRIIDRKNILVKSDSYMSRIFFVKVTENYESKFKYSDRNYA